MKKNWKLLMLTLALGTVFSGAVACDKTEKPNSDTSVDSSADTSDSSASAPDSSVSAPDSSSETPEVSIVLNKTSETLLVDGSVTLIAAVVGSEEPVIWASDNEAVATVMDNNGMGVVVAVADGTANITASIGDVTATCVITVRSETELVLNVEDSINLDAGTWTDSTGAIQGKDKETIVPQLLVNGNPVEAEFTFKSSAAQFVSVSDEGLVEVVSTNNGSAKAVITVSCIYNEVEYEKKINVNVTRFTVNSNKLLAFGGDTSKYHIDVQGTFGIDPDDVYSIYIDDEEAPDFIKMTEDGDYIRDENGYFVVDPTVLASDEQTAPTNIVIETETLKIEATVAFYSATNVKLICEVSPMTVGSIKKYTLTLFGQPVTPEENPVWTSSEDHILEVNEEGVITAKAVGTSVITASLYGYNYTATQVVYEEGTVDMSDEITNETTPDHGKEITTAGHYEAGDWVSFTITPAQDVSSGMLLAYYGHANDHNYPNGIWYAAFGAQSYKTSKYDDDTFIVLDSKGNRVGSIANGAGFGTLKANEKYTVYVQVPDDGRDDHSIYVIFASQELTQQMESAFANGITYANGAHMNGTLIWRDYLSDNAVSVTYGDVKAYAYAGETRENIVDKTATTFEFDSTSLDTENALDLSAWEIPADQTILVANIEGTKFDFFVRDENGLPVFEDNKLTIASNFYTFSGTGGVKTLIIETEDYKYTTKIDIKAPSEKFEAVDQYIDGSGNYTQLLTAQEYVDAVNAGYDYAKFDIYVYGDWEDALFNKANETGGKLGWFEIGVRHGWLLPSGVNLIGMGNGWQSDSQNIPADLFRAYDAEGNLVNNNLMDMNLNSINNPSATEQMQAGQWYTIIFNLNSRFDNVSDETIITANSGINLKGINTKFYVSDVTLITQIDNDGIILDTKSELLANGENFEITATLSAANENTPIEWTSSDETVATVVDGVVTALKAGKVTITATVNGQSATCEVTILQQAVIEDGSASTAGEIVSWLPGTFDVGAAGSNTNVAPAFVSNAEADYNAVQIKLNFAQEATIGLLHVYEVNTTDVNAWSLDRYVVKSTVIGANTYKSGGYTMANMDTLAIYDVAAEKNYYNESVAWAAGQEYILTYALPAGHSLVFFYTADDASQNPISNWNIPTYCYDVAANITMTATPAYIANSTTISLTAPAASLRVGEALTLNAAVGVTSNKTLTWISSDEDIATVVDGVVTGVGEGEVTVTATTADGKTATVTLTVKAATATIANVKFVIDGEVVQESAEAKIGETVTAYPAPDYFGYTFDGWFVGDSTVAYDFATAITGDVVFTAKYSLKEAANRCDIPYYGETDFVTWDVVRAGYEEGKNYAVLDITFESIPASGNIFYLQMLSRHWTYTAAGMNFVSNWDTNNYNPNDLLAIYYNGAAVTGALEAGKKYTFVFNVAANDPGYAAEVLPAQDALGFGMGLCAEIKTVVDFKGMMTQEVAMETAVPKVEVTFDINGTTETKKVAINQVMSAPALTEYFGYEAAWYVGDEKFDITKPVTATEAFTLTAKWTLKEATSRCDIPYYGETDFVTWNVVRDGYLENKNYAVLDITFESIPESGNIFYLQILSRHWTYTAAGMNFVSNWDTTNYHPETLLAIYYNGEAVTGALEVGKKYTFVFDVAGNDPGYAADILPLQDALGFGMGLCAEIKTVIDFKGMMTKEDADAIATNKAKITFVTEEGEDSAYVKVGEKVVAPTLTQYFGWEVQWFVGDSDVAFNFENAIESTDSILLTAKYVRGEAGSDCGINFTGATNFITYQDLLADIAEGKKIAVVEITMNSVPAGNLFYMQSFSRHWTITATGLYWVSNWDEYGFAAGQSFVVYADGKVVNSYVYRDATNNGGVQGTLVAGEKYVFLFDLEALKPAYDETLLEAMSSKGFQLGLAADMKATVNFRGVMTADEANAIATAAQKVTFVNGKSSEEKTFGVGTKIEAPVLPEYMGYEVQWFVADSDVPFDFDKLVEGTEDLTLTAKYVEKSKIDDCGLSIYGREEFITVADANVEFEKGNTHAVIEIEFVTAPDASAAGLYLKTFGRHSALYSGGLFYVSTWDNAPIEAWTEVFQIYADGALVNNYIYSNSTNNGATQGTLVAGKKYILIIDAKTMSNGLEGLQMGMLGGAKATVTYKGLMTKDAALALVTPAQEA